VHDRGKLVNKLLFSGFQDDVKRFCDDPIKGLEQNKVNSHILIQFVDNMINELESFNPMNRDAQQRSNVGMARIHCNRKQMWIQLAAYRACIKLANENE